MLILLVQVLIIRIVRLAPYLICFSTFHHESCLLGKIVNYFNFLSLNPETYYNCLYWAFILFLFLRDKLYFDRTFGIVNRMRYSVRYRRNLNRILALVRIYYILKVLFWKPLFKKTSYFGFFSSSRFFTKSTFCKKETKKKKIFNSRVLGYLN